MASLSVWLGGIFIFGLVVLGSVQTVLDYATGTGLAIAATEDKPQRDLNLCMNDCMRGCVTLLEEQDPCRGACEKECGA